MRIQTNSIVATLVILSLISGAVGCRSNEGPWYNPKSYSWQNPFKSKDAPPFETEGTAHASNPKPSTLAQPNVSTPHGGYYSKDDEARFYTGKKEMIPHYQANSDISGVGTDSSRVASTNPAYAPDGSYNTYGVPESNGLANNPVPSSSSYMPTNFHYDQTANTVPVTQPNGYPTNSGYQNPATPSPSTVTYNNYSNSAPAPAVNYSPFPAAVQDNTSYYAGPQAQVQPGFPAPQPTVQQVQQSAVPVAPANGGYVAPPPTPTSYNTDPATTVNATTFTVNPSNYPPNVSPYQPVNPPAGF